MFEKGDLIIYSNTGVCRVEAVGFLEGASWADPERQYYTLSPVYCEGLIYTPVDTTVFMRPIISREKANELIFQIPAIEETPYFNRNLKLLQNHYKASLETHRCEDLLQIIKAVYVKNQVSLKSGKKLGQIDQRYMKRAEDLLYGELAIALDIPYERVRPYIEDQVSALVKQA